jgi:hypothetical protein
MVHLSEAAPSSRDASKMSLGRLEFACLFLCYALALIYSVYCLFHLLAPESSHTDVTEPFSLSVLSYAALAGASIYYSRKLYKAGINRSYATGDHRLSIERISTTAYYLIRIPASVLIALVVYSAWRLSVDVASANEYVASGKAPYLYLLMGFFSGFSAGRFIERFEREGPRFWQSANNSE